MNVYTYNPLNHVSRIKNYCIFSIFYSIIFSKYINSFLYVRANVKPFYFVLMLYTFVQCVCIRARRTHTGPQLINTASSTITPPACIKGLSPATPGPSTTPPRRQQPQQEPTSTSCWSVVVLPGVCATPHRRNHSTKVRRKTAALVRRKVAFAKVRRKTAFFIGRA